MKNKSINVDSRAAEDLAFEEAFEKPFDFSNPYVNHAQKAREREACEQEALRHQQNRLTHASS